MQFTTFYMAAVLFFWIGASVYACVAYRRFHRFEGALIRIEKSIKDLSKLFTPR